jgi:quercetin dioxygenase-like cupin family protein
MGSDKSRCEKEEAKMKQMLIMLCLVTGTAVAQETTLISKELTGIPGKEATMITVRYDRGASDVIHQHNAHVFVYVLEGRVVMQVQGGEQLTLGPGQTFYERPDDVHLISRNASNTEPAKFLVFFVKNKGVPTLLPVN